MPTKILTIGVYGFNEDAFFDALMRAQVSHFVDIRLRRGMRGPQYAFVNSTRLQQRLADMGIAYSHEKALAPPQELRSIQRDQDAIAGISKRSREQLSPAFVHGYADCCLRTFDVRLWLERIPSATAVVLFCVEQRPEACHRSLVAEKVRDECGLPLEHILPCEY
jgi:uncharacterized protein (DUF488 family)